MARRRRVLHEPREHLLLATRDELELREKAHARVAAHEPAAHLGIRELRPVRHEQTLHVRRFRVRLRGLQPIHAALASLVPALDPVREPQRAVGPEVAVGDERAPQELLERVELEARALRLHREGVHAGVARVATEVADEERVRVRTAERRAGVVRESAWAVADVGERRDDVRRLALEVRLPQALVVPRPAQVGLGDPLVRLPPAGVHAFDHVHEARLVAAVGVVVDGPQLAVLVEHELLRIAQAGREDLEVRAVEVAAQHRSVELVAQPRTVRLRHAETTVAAGEIELAIGADAQAVQVMSDEREADAVARAQHALGVRHVIAIRVFELPQARHAGRVDLAFVLEHARDDPVRRGAELIGVDRARIREAVTVGVPHPLHALAVLRVRALELIAEMLGEVRDAIFDRPTREVVVEPVHVVADVVDAALETIRLGDVHLALVRHVHRDGIREVWLRGPQLHREAVGRLHARDRRGSIARGGSHVGLVGLVRLLRGAR